MAISPFSFFLARLLKVDKIALSTFLTSVNVAQKVKKFKTLTSVKKNLESLTKIFGKQRNFFLLKKKNVLLKKKKILLKRKKILLQRKFSGERSQKKEGSTALLNFMQIYIIFQRNPNLHFATFLQKLTVSHLLLLFLNLQKVRFLQPQFWAQNLKCTKKVKAGFSPQYITKTGGNMNYICVFCVKKHSKTLLQSVIFVSGVSRGSTRII